MRAPEWLFSFLLLAVGHVDAGNDCGYYVPRHIHLAVGPDPSTSMTVSFSSLHFHVWCDDETDDDPFDDEIPPTGYVYIGTSPDKLDRVVKEDTMATWYAADYVDQDSYESDYFHHITVTGLKPSTRYYYVVDTVKGIADDDEYEEDESSRRRRLELETRSIPSFMTAPQPGAFRPNRPVSLAILGDMGRTRSMIANMKKINEDKENIDAIIIAGDIAYTGLEHDKWDSFFDLWADNAVVAQIPIQVAAGNHDIDRHPGSGEIFVAYEHRFRMPQVKAAVQKPMVDMQDLYFNYDTPYPLPYDFGNAYYAFTYGPSRNIVLSSYSNHDPNSLQRQWLFKELNSIDRTITPWVTVTMHVPMYNTYNDHRGEEQADLAKKLELVFINHQVNFVFSGHVHGYSRTRPVAKGVVNNKGPVHIIAGTGGFEAIADFFAEEPEPWVAARDATSYGYGTITFLNKTHSYWKWTQSAQNEGHPLNTVCDGETVCDLELPSGNFSDDVYIRNQFFL